MTAIDWRGVQTRLGKLYAGAIDGREGPKSWIGIVDYAAPSQPNGSDAVTLRGRKLAEVAGAYGLTTAERVAGFLSNTAHETGDYRKLRENLYYKTVASIRGTWPHRFPTDASAAPFVRNPEALANRVYARPGEGNVMPGDGFRFRGGGDYQTTFRGFPTTAKHPASGYTALVEDLGLPLLDHPELIEAPAVAILSGLSYWRRNRLARFYDAGQPKRARALVNCGDPDAAHPIGWDDVLARHTRLMALLT